MNELHQRHFVCVISSFRLKIVEVYEKCRGEDQGFFLHSQVLVVVLDEERVCLEQCLGAEASPLLGDGRHLSLCRLVRTVFGDQHLELDVVAAASVVAQGAADFEQRGSQAVEDVVHGVTPSGTLTHHP